MSMDIVARGLSRQSAQHLASDQAGMGSALVGFRGLGSAAGRTVQDRLEDRTSVKDFGAQGDGSTDDTAAIQAAINAVLTPAGGALYFPDGIYRITDKLVIPFATGWRLFGASRSGAVIRQETSNKPIFSLEATNTWGWTIHSLTLTWSLPQPAANTAAVAIKMGSGTAGHSFYEWEVHDCFFQNGFRAIAADAVNSPSLWGVIVRNCNFGSMTGSGFFAVPTPSVGQPNICIENCLFNAAGASEETIRISSGDVVTLRNLEFLNGAAPVPLIQISTTFAVSISDCKSELYNLGTGGVQLFKFSNCNVRAINNSANGVTGTGGSSVFLFGNTGSVLTVIGATINTGMTGGTLYAYYGDTMPFICDIKLTGANASDNVFQFGGVSPKFDADKRQPDRIADLADASIVLTNASARLLYNNAALTANRTVTLPNAGLYDGMEFEIVRRVATPGAFTLQVVDPVSGVNHTIAASTNGFVRYRYRGAWRIMAAGTL